MDKIESLSSTLSNITMYDIKSMYTQAKNMVLNVSEMEAKVREATNEDPWGASSTLMQEIAQGTFHFQYFNEIMPSIYSRFMEKEARQWRQIYKALQLLEYLVKHGSERVVDDARSHISTLKMLRNFHYIDEKGKDEGVNVRNRSRELVELLSDVEKIRAERRKAKANKSKYIGVGNDGFGGFDSGGSRYGGFGSDSLGGGGSSYNNGESSSRVGGFSDNASRRTFEEYTAGDDEVVASKTTRSNSLRNPARKASAPAPPPASEPVVDLLGGFDDPPVPASASLATNKALPAVAPQNFSIDDDDFGDLQAAPVQNNVLTGGAAPPLPAAKPNLMDMLNSGPARPPVNTGFVQPQQQQMGYGMGMGMGAGMGHRQTPSLTTQYSSPLPQTSSPQTQTQNFMGNAAPLRPTTVGAMSSFSTPQYSSPLPQTSSPQMQTQNFMGSTAPLRPTAMGATSPLSSTMARPQSTGPAAKSSNFDDLWSMSLGGSSSGKPAAGAGKSIKDLEKEKALSGLWGGQQQQQQRKPVGGAPMPAFNSFGNSAPPSSSNGADDLLL